MRVFVSYSSQDIVFVKEEVVPLLRGEGFQVWHSAENVRTSQNWEKQIRQELLSSDWVLVVLSPNAMLSEWVQAEVHLALERKAGHVIPIMYRPCDPSMLHLKLPLVQWIDYTRSSSQAQQSLLNILKDEASFKRFAAMREPSAVVTGQLDVAHLVSRIVAYAIAMYDIRIYVALSVIGVGIVAGLTFKDFVYAGAAFVVAGISFGVGRQLLKLAWANRLRKSIRAMQPSRQELQEVTERVRRYSWQNKGAEREANNFLATL